MMWSRVILHTSTVSVWILLTASDEATDGVGSLLVAADNDDDGTDNSVPDAVRAVYVKEQTNSGKRHCDMEGRPMADPTLQTQTV